MSQQSSPTPASNDDIFLYRSIGASFFCNSREQGVEFAKALSISTLSYGQVIKGKHGNKISSVSDEALTDKQIIGGAEMQIITASMQFCPQWVPEEVQTKVKDVLAQQDNNSTADKKPTQKQTKKKRRFF